MSVYKKNIGFALTGSFCTFEKVFLEIERLINEDAIVYPIFSYNASSIDNKFGKASDFLNRVEEITGKKPVTTIVEAETFGPGNILDIIVLAPCTGNTIAKLANGITDTPVLMAAKGHMRNNKPLVLAIATNDAMSANLKNIGLLMNSKNVFFVPFGQDNYLKKPFSMVAHFDMILPTINKALEGKQLQPVIYIKGAD